MEHAASFLKSSSRQRDPKLRGLPRPSWRPCDTRHRPASSGPSVRRVPGPPKMSWWTTRPRWLGSKAPILSKIAWIAPETVGSESVLKLGALTRGDFRACRGPRGRRAASWQPTLAFGSPQPQLELQPAHAPRIPTGGSALRRSGPPMTRGCPDARLHSSTRHSGIFPRGSKAFPRRQRGFFASKPRGLHLGADRLPTAGQPCESQPCDRSGWPAHSVRIPSDIMSANAVL